MAKTMKFSSNLNAISSLTLWRLKFFFNWWIEWKESNTKTNRWKLWKFGDIICQRFSNFPVTGTLYSYIQWKQQILIMEIVTVMVANYTRVYRINCSLCVGNYIMKKVGYKKIQKKCRIEILRIKNNYLFWWI